MDNKKIIRFAALGGVIAALYTVATFLSAALGLSYGAIQFRISEALTILPLFFPEAITGLTLGCVISNLASPLGIIDILCGSAATLIAALGTRALRNIKIKKLPVLSMLCPVLSNGIIVGAEIAFLSKGAFLPIFLITALQVAIGELLVLAILGTPLYFGLAKHLTKL